MAAGPIQVVLNAADFHVDREKPQGGGPGADFFAENDAAFAQHREAMRAQLESVARQLEADPRSAVGYGKVTIRRSMWAKSHRPTRALFRPDRTPIVGGADLGQLLVELTPDSARAVAHEVASAEDHVVRTRYNKQRDRHEPAPSPRRSETGAIEAITLWQAHDRRRFSVEQALTWLHDPRSGGAYLVELFEPPPSETEWDALPAAKRELFRSFRDGLLAQGPGLIAEGRTLGATGRPWILIKLNRSSAPPLIQLDRSELVHARQHLERAERDLRPARHEVLLSFLDHHPLVRRIRLQPRPRAAERAMPSRSASE